MALPTFPNSPAVGDLHTTNGITWRYRADLVWEPLGFNAQNYYVTPEMFGAKGDAVTDDTFAVQACLSAANKTKMFRPGATYLVTARLNMLSQQNTKLYGNGARILRNQTDGMYPGQPNNPNTGYVNPGIDQHILVLKNCKDIFIDGLRIRGGYNPASPQTAGINTSYWSNSQTNGRGEDGHGISLSSCESVVVQNSEIVNVWGDAFWLQSGGYLGDASLIANKNITIRDNDIRNPFRGCVSSVHHNGLIFEGNYCEKYTGYTTAVLLEPNNNVAQNCVDTRVTNNSISCGPSGVFAATSAGALLNGDFIRDIVVANNAVSGVVFVSLTSPNATGIVIDNNSFYNSGLIPNASQFGLFLEAYNARDVKITNNMDYSGGTSDAYFRGARMELCSNISFEKHTIRPQDAKTNVEYFQVISTNYFRLLDSLINGRDTVDPNGTAIVSMYGSSSYCRVEGNYFNGTGTTQGVVYLEQASYTGVANSVKDNVITSASSSNAIILKANYFGTAVGANVFTSGRLSNVSGGTSQCYQHPSAASATMLHTFGPAAPTTGTWALGSRVINTGAGPTDYWECTAGGTPGTWVARN
jgi:hypothetical protein